MDGSAVDEHAGPVFTDSHLHDVRFLVYEAAAVQVMEQATGFLRNSFHQLNVFWVPCNVRECLHYKDLLDFYHLPFVDCGLRPILIQCEYY